MPRSSAIYCRISRDRVGAELSVDWQEKDCCDLAQRLGWTITAIRTDNDISAYSGKFRPGYWALLDDLRAGRVDAILAWHNDRLNRSAVELEEYIEVCGAAPTHFVKAGPPDQSVALDPTVSWAIDVLAADAATSPGGPATSAPVNPTPPRPPRAPSAKASSTTPPDPLASLCPSSRARSRASADRSRRVEAAPWPTW